MNLLSISYAVSGFGLLLFALRFLTDSLDREISRYLGGMLQRVSKNPWSALLSGVLTTLVVQASSVTVITTMGFLSRGLLTLDRSILIVLGAAIGSTLKGWYGTQLPLLLGPALVFVGAVGLVTRTNQRRGRLWAVVTAVGVTFLGLQLIETGLAPIAQTDFAKKLLVISVDDGMISVLKTVGFGFLVTVVLQSSSSVLLLVLGLSSQNLISVPSAIGLILGANVGTTSTSLLASLGHENTDVRRLGYGYFLVKAFAVAFVLTYFRTHITLIEDVFHFFGWAGRPDLLIVTFHTWLNIMNALTWWLLLPLMVRALSKLVPGKEALQGTTPFTVRIQKLLGSIPGKALSEGVNKLQQVIRDLHWVSDSVFHIIDQRGQKEEYCQLLEESLRKCERTLEVLDSIRDISWRHLRSSENSFESRQKVLGLVTLTSDLKNIEVILYSCIQTLFLEGLAFVSEGDLTLSHFKAIRDRLNQSWEKVYSLELFHEKAKHLSPELYEKSDANCHLFEITARLNSARVLLEHIGCPEVPFYLKTQELTVELREDGSFSRVRLNETEAMN